MVPPYLFSTNDNGADLVETSYLVNGLLCARQYFNNNDPAEIDLRTKINAIWNAVEWNWFRQNSQEVLYWHWSNTGNWIMNFKVEGWNEAHDCLCISCIFAILIRFR